MKRKTVGIEVGLDYETFKVKYQSWLKLTPLVHTLSPCHPLKRTYDLLGGWMHDLDVPILKAHLARFEKERFAGSA